MNNNTWTKWKRMLFINNIWVEEYIYYYGDWTIHSQNDWRFSNVENKRTMELIDVGIREFLTN